MRHFNRLFALLLFVPCPIFADEAPATVGVDNPPCNLTLQDAQRYALEQNPSLQAVGEKVEQAKALAMQARSMYFPQVQASVNVLFQWLSQQDKDSADDALDYLRGLTDNLNDTVNSAGLVIGSHDARSLRRDLRKGDNYLADLQEGLDDAIEQYTYGVSMKYLAFDGFARKHTNAIARFGYEETQLAHLEAKRLLLEYVAQAYWAVQLAGENLRVAESDKSFNARLLEDATAMLDYGKAPLSSVLNFQVAVKAAEVRQISAEGDLEAARLALARLMGLADAKMREGDAVCPMGEVNEADLQRADTEIELAYALQHRPDLLQKESSVDRAGAEVSRRKAAFYPQVGVMAGIQDNFNFNQGPSLDSLSPQIGVGVSLDLYTGGRRKAAVYEAEHARREAEWYSRDALLNVQYEVRDAALELGTAQERYLLLVDTARVVKETRDLVELEYRAGKEPLTRLNQAQRDLVQAEGQLAMSHVALFQAQFALDTVTAKSLEGWNEERMESVPIETKVE